MTLTQLKYAITVSEAGSMNQAAKELFISQPSLSLAIRDLEEEIGVELFRRSSRGILLTPDGEEFIGYAKQVVEQYQLIELIDAKVPIQEYITKLVKEGFDGMLVTDHNSYDGYRKLIPPYPQTMYIVPYFYRQSQGTAPRHCAGLSPYSGCLPVLINFSGFLHG